MDFSPELLEILACPSCHGKVRLDEGQGGFVCEACAVVYLVQDGIPNFLPEEARPLGAQRSEPGEG